MGLIRKFRKKPIIVEAIQYNGENAEEIEKFTDCKAVAYPNFIAIKTLEGTMSGTKGDWIIKGVLGEFYSCKDNVFIQTYEEVK